MMKTLALKMSTTMIVQLMNMQEKIALVLFLCLSVFLSSSVQAQTSPETPKIISTILYLLNDESAPGSTGSPNIGIGCDCDQSVYDYCEGSSVSVSRGDSTITYSFSEPVYCDVFANGYDVSVAPKTANSIVTLSNSTPLLEGAGDALRNGFDVNPTSSDDNTLDGRLGDGIARSYPHAINTSVDKITSIIKADSRDDTSDCRDDSSDRYKRGCFDHIDVLTVLDEMPANGVGGYFRPAFYGDSASKELRLRSSVDLSRLPSIPAQTRGTEDTLIDMDQDFNQVLATMSGIKFGWQREYVATERFKAYENFGQADTGYSANVFGPIWNQLQYLYLDPEDFGISQEQKNELAYRVVEHGLDAIQIVLEYPRSDAPWVPNGGHGVGRYGFAAIAMSLLNDGGSLAAEFNAKINGSDLAEQSFAETGQIVNGSNGYSVYGIRSVSGGKSSQSCLSSVNQLPRHEQGLVDNGRVNEFSEPGFSTASGCSAGAIAPYQTVASPVFISQGIVCWMIPSCLAIADAEWLDYTDRMVTIGAKAYAEEDPTAGVIVDVQVFYECDGGSNDGLIALLNSDCPGGSRVAPNNSTITGEVSDSSSAWRGTSRNSRFGLMMYEKLRNCLQDSSCEGQ